MKPDVAKEDVRLVIQVRVSNAHDDVKVAFGFETLAKSMRKSNTLIQQGDTTRFFDLNLVHATFETGAILIVGKLAPDRHFARNQQPSSSMIPPLSNALSRGESWRFLPPTRSSNRYGTILSLALIIARPSYC